MLVKPLWESVTLFTPATAVAVSRTFMPTLRQEGMLLSRNREPMTTSAPLRSGARTLFNVPWAVLAIGIQGPHSLKVQAPGSSS